MANHASALKRAKQNENRRVRNQANRTRMRRAIKAVRLALEDGDAQAAQAALTQALPVIDKAASRGVIHRNNASRKVSRLSKQVNALGAGS